MSVSTALCYNKLNDYQLVDDILHSSVEGDVVKGMGLVDHHLERVVDEKKVFKVKVSPRTQGSLCCLPGA